MAYQDYMQPSESLNSMDFCENDMNEIYEDGNIKNSRSERRVKAKSKSLRKIKRKTFEQTKNIMGLNTNSFNQHVSIFNPDIHTGLPKLIELKNESENLLSKPKDSQSLPYNSLSSLSIQVNDSTSTCLSSSFNVPQERVEFFKKFSMLINLGNDLKNKSWERQLSNEEEEWRGEFKDCLWRQLNAFLKTKSIQDFEETLRSDRQIINNGLNAIMNFKLAPNCDNNLLSEPEDDFTKNTLLHSISSSMLGIRQDLIIIEKAANDVIVILKTLNSIEALYPTLKSMIKDNSFYASYPFQMKIEILYMWINLTFEQLIKIKTIIKLMELPNKNISIEFGFSLTLIEKLLCKYYAYYGDEKKEAIKIGSSCTETAANSPNIATDSPFSLTPNINLDASSKSKLATSSRQSSVVSKNQSFSNSTDSSDCNLLMPRKDSSSTNLYRAYVDHMLKKIGIKKLCTRMYLVLKDTLQRSKVALFNPEFTSSVIPISEHSVYSEQFIECGLPSFLPIFLFLARIPLDVVHECLLLRLEQKPMNPPFDVLRQLMEECRDVLYAAVDVKQYYLDLIEGVVNANHIDMDYFENNLGKMLDVYFEYLKIWMESLQRFPEMSKKMKNFLEEEWSFTKKICPYINGGEAGAAKNFCILLSSLLQSISDFVDNGVDDCTKNLVTQNSNGDYSENSTASSKVDRS